MAKQPLIHRSRRNTDLNKEYHIYNMSPGIKMVNYCASLIVYELYNKEYMFVAKFGNGKYEKKSGNEKRAELPEKYNLDLIRNLTFAQEILLLFFLTFYIFYCLSR
jgi:hypothetical protein